MSDSLRRAAATDYPFFDILPFAAQASCFSQGENLAAELWMKTESLFRRSVIFLRDGYAKGAKESSRNSISIENKKVRPTMLKISSFARSEAQQSKNGRHGDTK